MRLALILAFAASLAAQEKIVESIEVKVANVDVVVTDRTGHPVTGLTKNDFELFENGKPQTITNFYEIAPKLEPSPARITTPPSSQSTPPAPGAATEDIRARRFVIMIDNYSLEPIPRDKVIAAAHKFVDTNMRPTDQASVIVWARGTEIVTPLTNDKAAILRGLDSIASRSRSGLSPAGEEAEAKRECRQMLSEVGSRAMTAEQAAFDCKGAVNEHADRIWANEKTMLADMKSIVSLLAGVDGRRILVLAGESLPQNPGRELLMWAAQLFGQNPARAMGESFSRSQTLGITDVARYASANGVAFYMIDTADQRDETSAEVAERPDYTLEFGKFTNTASAYKALADITGGAALTGTQNFDSAFQTLAQDISYFYSLGYKPGEGKGDRKITVRVKKPGLTVRSRQNFTPKTTEQEMNDRVIANLFREPEPSTWPIKMTAGEPQPNGTQFDIPLTVEMDPNITLIPQGDKLVGSFTLYIVAGMKDGGTSKVSKTERKIEIPAEAESDFRSRPIVFTLTLTVRPGNNMISVAVADGVSDATGFDHVEVSAQN